MLYCENHQQRFFEKSKTEKEKGKMKKGNKIIEIIYINAIKKV